MSFGNKDRAESEVRNVGSVDRVAEEASELQRALTDFRLSVRAWSEAEFNRPRTVVEPVRRGAWRLAAGWALGCLLIAGSVSGGIVHKHHQDQMKIAQTRMIEQRRLAAEERARQEEEDLLAKVDGDVSREVPSAMEPLAQLMAEDESQ
jgi:hypothetical protein